jgi:predicted transcriptional regulator
MLIHTDGAVGFKERVLSHARALDNGKALPAENGITFNSVHEMLQVLTPKRIVLLETLTTTGERPVNLLAKDLRRKRSSVLRDISILRKIGVVSTAYDKSRVFTAKPLATRYEFQCSIDSLKPRRRVSTALAS